METDLEFLAKLKGEIFFVAKDKDWIRKGEFERLLRLAETAALIVENRMWIDHVNDECRARLTYGKPCESGKELHTVVHAVAAKIGEGK